MLKCTRLFYIIYGFNKHWAVREKEHLQLHGADGLSLKSKPACRLAFCRRLFLMFHVA